MFSLSVLTEDRLIAYFLCPLQLLWPFQTFSNSKGHDFLLRSGLGFGAEIDNAETENDEPVLASFNPSDLSRMDGKITVLGVGDRENVKFEWMITPWSECSQTCGTEMGFRVIWYKAYNTMIWLYSYWK